MTVDIYKTNYKQTPEETYWQIQALENELRDCQIKISQDPSYPLSHKIAKIAETLKELGPLVSAFKNPSLSQDLRIAQRNYKLLQLTTSPSPVALPSIQAPTPKLTGSLIDEVRMLQTYHRQFLQAENEDIFAYNALLSQLLRFQATFPKEADHLFKRLSMENFFDKTSADKVKYLLRTFTLVLPRSAAAELREIRQLLNRLQKFIDKQEISPLDYEELDDDVEESLERQLRKKLFSFQKNHKETAQTLFKEVPFENFFDNTEYAKASVAIADLLCCSQVSSWGNLSSSSVSEVSKLPPGLSSILSEINICLVHKNMYSEEDGEVVRQDLHRCFDILEKEHPLIAKELYLCLKRSQFFYKHHHEAALRVIDSLLKTGQPFTANVENSSVEIFEKCLGRILLWLQPKFTHILARPDFSPNRS